MGRAGVVFGLLVAFGCGDQSPGGGFDGAPQGDGAAVDGAEAGDGGAVDAGSSGDGGDCTSWQLVPATVTGVSSMDPVAVNDARTTRVVVKVELSSCQERAMAEITYQADTHHAYLTMSAWQRSADCGGATATVFRPVALRFPAVGTWSVVPGPPGSTADGIEVVVEAAPDRPCNTSASPCLMDCDCDYGERCLGGYGLGGQFTQCAQPCELDRDCGGGTCISMEDGLDDVCEPSLAECGEGGRECLDGYSCSGGACDPDFLLGQATRVPCGCDADCAVPLRCVRDGDGPGRCELACPTGGAWCSAGHYCGPAAQDIAGLAEVDSVCVWAGD